MVMLKVDDIEYDIPPVVVDILNATAYERDELLEALEQIDNLPDNPDGRFLDRLHEARAIARAVYAKIRGPLTCESRA